MDRANNLDLFRRNIETLTESKSIFLTIDDFESCSILRECEREAIRQVVQFHKGDLKSSAKTLGISEQKLKLKIVEFRLNGETRMTSYDDDLQRLCKESEKAS